MEDGSISVSSQKPSPKDRKKYWHHHITAWRHSGLSQRAYCQKNNLKEDRFSHWKSRFTKENQAAGNFIRVPVPANLPVPVKPNVLHLYCPNGFRVDVEEGFSPGLLKRLLILLGEVSHAM